MRIIALSIAICGFAQISYASFDLVLIADSANGVIHRVDGDSGLYLGSFGQGILSSPQSIAINQATSTVYVSDPITGMSSFNYNTGEALFSSAVGAVSSDMCVAMDGRIYFSYNANSTTGIIRMDNLNSFGVQYASTGTLLHRGIGVDSTGDVVVQDVTGNRLMRYNPAITAAPEAFGTAGSFLGVSKGAASGSTFVAMKADGSMLSMNTQTLTGVLTGFAPSVTFTSVTDVAFGHQNYLWGLGKTAAGTRLQRYTRINSAFSYSPLSGFNYAQINTPSAIAVVIAPEPGTMLGLCAGLAWLSRRKKS